MTYEPDGILVDMAHRYPRKGSRVCRIHVLSTRERWGDLAKVRPVATRPSPSEGISIISGVCIPLSFTSTIDHNPRLVTMSADGRGGAPKAREICLVSFHGCCRLFTCARCSTAASFAACAPNVPPDLSSG